MAEWQGDSLTIYESTQGIFMTRTEVAKAFKLPMSKVRVIMNYMGGGFGAKNGAPHSTYAAAALAKLTGRPVRCILDREGEQTDAGNRPATVQQVTLGAKRDGTLTAIQLDAYIPLGAGGWLAGPAGIYQEMYKCANVHTTERFAYVHTSPMASFRAPGHTEGSFGLECAMDVLAGELGIDPLELRRRNYAERDQRRNREYSHKMLDACYTEGAKRFGWDARAGRTKSERRAACSARRRDGVGRVGRGRRSARVRDACVSIAMAPSTC